MTRFGRWPEPIPAVAPLRELRHSLGEMRLFSDLAVGIDGRNRCLLSPFRSITGRNQPSNARFIFGPSCWLRSLIQPEPGRAVAYVDWSQQEFGIAAALSGDTAMMDAYTSGDPYLTFAKQARAVPADATKKSHPREREQFKVCALAVQYGMGPQSLARSLGQPEAMARELLRLHRETYPTFWRWSDSAVNHAMLRGWLQTVFGWRVQVGPRANPRSLANFPMQANGAEMLRLACCLATERGVAVCAPVHDALLVEGPAGRDSRRGSSTPKRAMTEASRVVLSGFELRSDAKIVCHPDRYSDPRGEANVGNGYGADGRTTPSRVGRFGRTVLRRSNPGRNAGVTPAKSAGVPRPNRRPVHSYSLSVLVSPQEKICTPWTWTNSEQDATASHGRPSNNGRRGTRPASGS